MLRNDPRNLTDEELDQLIEDSNAESVWDEDEPGDITSFDYDQTDTLEDLLGEDDL